MLVVNVLNTLHCGDAKVQNCRGDFCSRYLAAQLGHVCSF
jgi:hypothetical protein